MNSLDLAKLLVESDPSQQRRMIGEHKQLPAIELAESLQTMCYEAWTDDPQRVAAIVETVDLIADYTGNAEVRAYADWTEAIKALVDGDLGECINRIGSSEAAFNALGRSHLAAKTQTSKLYALALLGRYDEAVACGLKAREIFIEHGDLYSTGKIEHNIGNLYWRRDMYSEAEPFLVAAHERFVQIDDQRQLAMVENCQAFVKTLQNQFREAETIYHAALARTSDDSLNVTAAEIETGLSNLYLFEGKFDLALKYMEHSRQKYEDMGMANQSALCELEIADIYLELNLLPEAAAFYEKVGPRFAHLGMQAELARCSLSNARVLLRQGETDKAARLLDTAEELYEKEGNHVALGSVSLARSQMHFDAGNIDAAEEQVERALSIFEGNESYRLELFSRWLRSEIWRIRGRLTDAERELDRILKDTADVSGQIEYLCRVSLGKITGDEEQFAAAVDLVENSRSLLGSDELRTSFFSDRIAPYDELVKLNMARGQFEKAFLWHERSRSRALVDSMQESRSDLYEDEKLVNKREELNWLYNRINRSSLSTAKEREDVAGLRKAAFDKENEYAERLRRISSLGEVQANAGFDLDIDAFRDSLDDTTVIEFASYDGKISAFVISKENFTALPGIADESEVNREIKHFLFQIQTGRLIDKLSAANQLAAASRLLNHSRRLYDLLLAPLNDLIQTKRIVFSPAGLLHYLPFHALHDGNDHLIRRSEISYTPSVSVLDRCLMKPAANHQRALIVGVADALTPLVEAEMDNVAKFFDRSIRLAGPDTTLANIRQNIPGMGVIHLACHGRFRPDNPGFSSLTLYAEDLTMKDVHNLPLENCIIVLSACESGLNEVVRGEELIGLTRAFFAAGASSLVLSLWRVADTATLDLMSAFYDALSSGNGPAEALRNAQLQLIGNNSHPYFWSPFVVSGRW